MKLHGAALIVVVIYILGFGSLKRGVAVLVFIGIILGAWGGTAIYNGLTGQEETRKYLQNCDAPPERRGWLTFAKWSWKLLKGFVSTPPIATKF